MTMHAKSSPASPTSDFVSSGGELRLSNQSQRELLRAVLARGVSMRTPVRGNSMYPFICDCDVLTIAPLKEQKLRIGQVVAFIQARSESLVVHRVIASDGEILRIRGDNSDQDDFIVDSSQLLGLVTRIERGGRHVRLGLGAEARWIALLNRWCRPLRIHWLFYLGSRIFGFSFRRRASRKQCIIFY